MENKGLPRSRSEALSVGSSYYFTGEPCKYGHVDRRKTKNGMCYTCWRRTVSGRDKVTGGPLIRGPDEPLETQLQRAEGRLSSLRIECADLRKLNVALGQEVDYLKRRVRDLEHDVVRYRDG